MTLYIVVPVFNELANLDRLFASFRTIRTTFDPKYQVRFVVVDDGSTDGTPERVCKLAGDLKLDLLSNPINQGPGAAFASVMEAPARRAARSRTGQISDKIGRDRLPLAVSTPERLLIVHRHDPPGAVHLGTGQARSNEGDDAAVAQCRPGCKVDVRDIRMPRRQVERGGVLPGA